MILSRAQLAQMQQLFDGQTLPATFPGELEYAFLGLLAQDMTLQDYVDMPEDERRKWWISSRIMAPVPLGFTDPETGEELFETGFYFEPVSPEILNRIY